MNVIATSQVPTQVPYVHLGYTSAGPVQKVSSAWPLLGLGTALGVIWLAKHLNIPKHVKWLLRFVGVMVAVCTSLALLWVVGTGAHDSGRITRTRMSRVGSVIHEQDEAGELPLPTADDGLVRLDTVVDMERAKRWQRFSHDGWGRPIMLERHGDRGGGSFLLVSGGRDGKLHTDDDLKMPVSLYRDRDSIDKTGSVVDKEKTKEEEEGTP